MARNILVALESTLCVDEPYIVVEDDKQDEDCCETEISSKIAQLSMQNSPNTYSSTQHMPNKVSEDTEAWTGTADLRKPLSHLVDATRKTKSKFVMQGDADKPVPEDSHANEAHLVTPKVMENGNNLKVHDDGNGNVWSRHAQKRKLLSLRG
ncbi:E3 ubiquitin protein ligase drip2 [Quillaja saponaria]|uniref:E3 ubiquitin protein ligase drip2 n=1 Tax=Quillaja saponaria TaxID=32244 RepID=A0AAD7LAX3_QUISA|nr:E3 ubiquitin protein ligase drip2 [Quillaja saponaria]